MIWRVLFLFIPILFGKFSHSQQTICIGDEATICDGEQVEIELCTGTGTPDTNVVFLNNVTNLNLGDDQYSGVANIGFGFEFYGTNYNNCIISSNGYISFNTGGANGFSPWAINNAVPNPALPVNTVMAPWQDYNPAAPGSGPVSYSTFGTAPNRKFVVLWKDQVMFGNPDLGCSAVVLHETTNKIEVFIDEKPVVAWNGGAAIEATHNVNGTLADVVPGRNWPNQWVTNLDGQEWIPDGPNNYIQNAIPYKAYVIGNTQNVWGDTQGNVYTPNSPSLTVTPNPPAGVDSVGYFVNYSSCATTQLLTSDTSWVKLYTAQGDYTPVSCPGGDDGTATVSVDPTPPLGTNLTYNWIDLGGLDTDSVGGLEAGTYTVEVDIDGGCVTSVDIIVDEVPGIDISLVSSSDVTCNSGSDGEAVIEVNQGNPPYEYAWDNSNSTGPIGENLPAGVNTVTVSDQGSCDVEFEVIIDEPTPLQVASLTDDLEICEGDTALVSATGGGGSSPYIYTWTLNGSPIGEGDTVKVVPNSPNSQVCVTVSEECGSPSADSCMQINFPNPISADISPNIEGDCYPVDIEFTNNLENPDIDFSIWDYGNGNLDTIQGNSNSSNLYEAAGSYTVNIELVTNNGCKFETSFPNIVQAYDYPVSSFSLNPNPAILYDPVVNAYNQSSGDAIIFDWYAPGASPSSGTDLDMVFKYPTEEGEYFVELYAENEFGCADTMQQRVEIIDEVNLYAPNSFTPDSDGINDTWRVHISGIDVQDFNLLIFNRWGEIVFESNNPEIGWDGSYGGRTAPDGVYVWTIRALDERTDDIHEFKGSITLIR